MQELDPPVEYRNGVNSESTERHEQVEPIMERSIGDPFPMMEIRFENLSISADIIVKDQTQLQVDLPTISNVVKTGLMWMSAKKNVVKKQILRNVSGVLKPGTMTLVLGQPGSGKSALMKILSGRFPVRNNVTVEGEVTYNGKTQRDMRDKLPQFVSYVGQHDKHYPTLTVKETLEFAYECSGGTLSNCGVEHDTPETNDSAMKTCKHHPGVIIHQLGLDNCQNTVLGDAMLRGVSGGERKRVTTGEMSFGNKLVLMLDEISTSLDSAATFDIVSIHCSLAKSFGKTVVISLLQPSPQVFELFDDVMLLNDGYVVYHGPRPQVLNHFENLGFKCAANRDVADFLLDLGTSKQLQYEVDIAPRNASEFADRFKHSSIHSRILDALDSPLEFSLFGNTNEYGESARIRPRIME